MMRLHRARMRPVALILLAEKTVTATQARLPEELRTLALAVPVHYEQIPSAEVLAEGFESDILGLFTGNPHGTELTHDLPAPPQILLYLDNLWDYAAGDKTAFREEVRLTYLHELGHFFGWDEAELTARGLD